MSAGPRSAVLGVLWVYRRMVSPLLPPCCRFRPTCSEYAQRAIQRFGVIKGGAMGLRRICKCHPFYRGNLNDPVPEPGRCRATSALNRNKAHG